MERGYRIRRQNRQQVWRQMRVVIRCSQRSACRTGQQHEHHLVPERTSTTTGSSLLSPAHGMLPLDRNAWRPSLPILFFPTCSPNARSSASPSLRMTNSNSEWTFPSTSGVIRRLSAYDSCSAAPEDEDDAALLPAERAVAVELGMEVSKSRSERQGKSMTAKLIPTALMLQARLRLVSRL